MAEQSYANHQFRPWLFNAAVVFWIFAVAVFVRRLPGDWMSILGGASTLATLAALIWASRVYAIRLQDRIILLEMKVRAAEVLQAGEDAKLAQLKKSQIVALRFASDAELGELLDRAIRDKLSSKEIKMAVKNWKADLLRT